MKVHIGCGSIILDGWLNTDLDAPNTDRRVDITQPLPFQIDSVKFIYLEHVIEHIERTEAAYFLSELLRVLSPGGVARISTPNLDVLIDAYIRGDISRYGDIWQPTTSCRLLNEGMRSWGHKFLYDANELVLIGREAGFMHSVFAEYGKSRYPELCGLESRPFNGELIIEYTKWQQMNRRDMAVEP
jgi:predicted SAM-dependent methyltransferase